ncbi:sodium:calcium antiporter [Candidatus Woesearchaeota archaeon]|nr:sodium:calcium antiporter [Candidatus Woesearchaeota archaeon]
MLELIFTILMLVIGIIILTKGSAWMTDSLAPVAEKLGTSYIAVASIIVSIMLSIPEVFVALYAFILGHEGISLGVIIGSIICNIGLMTGLSATIKPLSVDRRVVIRDGVFAFIIALIVLIFGWDLHYSRSEGLVLLLMFIPYVLNVWFFEKWRPMEEKKEDIKEISEELKVIGLSGFDVKHGLFKPGIFLFIVGSLMLLVGSYIFSGYLVDIAKLTGLSDVLIGLTIGAIGPSIPNVASAIQGTIKNYTKIAITETFGADIFTLLVTLGLLAVVVPFNIEQKWLFFDIPMMILMTALMMLFIFRGHIRKQNAITRSEGAALVIIYIVFLLLNILIIK